ncbi:hypothetical protein NECID01_1529 [Nematocida sp. AWRm77]|nr:hypothetical protein NECID01_1529 [Nematocida sp. AWRm77]
MAPGVLAGIGGLIGGALGLGSANNEKTEVVFPPPNFVDPRAKHWDDVSPMTQKSCPSLKPDETRGLAPPQPPSDNRNTVINDASPGAQPSPPSNPAPYVPATPSAPPLPVTPSAPPLPVEPITPYVAPTQATPSAPSKPSTPQHRPMMLP